MNHLLFESKGHRPILRHSVRAEDFNKFISSKLKSEKEVEEPEKEVEEPEKEVEEPEKEDS